MHGNVAKRGGVAADTRLIARTFPGRDSGAKKRRENGATQARALRNFQRVYDLPLNLRFTGNKRAKTTSHAKEVSYGFLAGESVAVLEEFLACYLPRFTQYTQYVGNSLLFILTYSVKLDAVTA
ncbi:hypothetical protein KSC_019950 [Ktedonobacter sp. SOSP1-52]|nr:hypothetical protein KSC_019950 [Ktedonobacter sp. SOSP1-52]